MSRIRPRISLAHLTVLDASPLELIDAASTGAFDSIGLRIVAPTVGDSIVPVIGNKPLMRDIEQRLRDTGIDILDIEAIWLGPDSDPGSYEAAFETGGQLGAKHVLVVGNDRDEARMTANFARMCRLARPFGLKLMLEFIPYALPVAERARLCGEATHRFLDVYERERIAESTLAVDGGRL